MWRLSAPAAAAVLCLFVALQPASASTVYAVQLYPNSTFLTFDTSAPASQTVINPAFPQSFTGWGIDFNPGGTTLYGLNSQAQQFGTINTSTGVFTQLAGVTGLNPNETITSMKIDPTTGVFYVSSSSISSSTLYTLNPATGALTVVGTTTTAPSIISLAISFTGEMYATDLVNNSLYSIDKSTGAATLIGALGYDINFAQGMDFDYSTGVLYAALVGNFSPYEFASIDLNTGAATALHDLDGQELDIAIQSPAGVPEPSTFVLLGTGFLGALGGMRRKLLG